MANTSRPVVRYVKRTLQAAVNSAVANKDYSHAVYTAPALRRGRNV